MGIESIEEVINNSNLQENVKRKAINTLDSHSSKIERMIEGLYFKPPTAHEEFYHEITKEIMSIIGPILIESKVQRKEGCQMYNNIYKVVARGLQPLN